MTAPRPTALVLRALGLGDLVTGLPALRLLRTALPHYRVVLATPRCWAPLVARSDPAIELLDAAELQPLVAPPPSPELAIDLHGNGPASRQILEACTPQRLLAYADGEVRWRRAEHEVARWCRLLREGLPAPGVHDPPLAGILGPPPSAPLPGGHTVVHCGAAAASRRWPAERFAAVARELADDGHDVIITGGPGEGELAAAVAAAARRPVYTQLSLTELLNVLGTARLLVSGDTGVAHLAAAYAVPTVTLFGPVSPRRWGPPPHRRHQVLWHGDDTGDPHGRDVDPALLAIAVDEVIAAARIAAHPGACDA